MTLFNFIFLMSDPGSGQSPIPTFVFMGAIFLVFYWFMIRPQTKKANEQKKFVDEMKKGDRVVTTGGIHGRILKVNEHDLLLEVDQNTKLKIEKGVISMDFSKDLQNRTSND